MAKKPKKQDDVVSDLQSVFDRWVVNDGERRVLERIEDWCDERLANLEGMRSAEEEEAADGR